MENQKVWVYYHGDHNVGGGGAEVEIYSSAEIAMQNNPGEWELTSPGYYELKTANYYEQIVIYETEIDSNKV